MAEARRLILHEKLCEILGNRNVYYQPPESKLMEYPCIRYSKSDIDILNANDRVYKKVDQYEVIVMDFDPDSTIADRILDHFPMCRFDRSYPSDNIYHTIITLYF